MLRGFIHLGHSGSSAFIGLKRSAAGFTLAELLIALAILGVIATFTIPKVLQSQQDSRNTAIAREAASAISAIWADYKQKNSASSSARFEDLMTYSNYVAVDTVSTIDTANNKFSGTLACSDTANYVCYKLHNGAVIYTNDEMQFSGTAANNGVVFVVDPDGKASSTPGVGFALFYNGRLTTYGNAGTVCYTDHGGSFCAPYDASYDPAWFYW